MHRYVVTLAWLAFSMVALSSGAGGNTLVFYTENSAPNNYLDTDGKTVRGLATEKIEAAFAKLGLSYSIVVTNWSRAMNLAKLQSNACVYSTARIPEREATFQWVAPVAESSWYIWGKSEALKPSSLDDLRGKMICDLLGNAPGRYLIAHGQKVVSSDSHEICVKNVMRGFVDYWSTSLQAGNLEVARLGYQGQIVPLYEFKHADLYLACNLSVPKQTIEQMKAALTQNAPSDH